MSVTLISTTACAGPATTRTELFATRLVSSADGAELDWSIHVDAPRGTSVTTENLFVCRCGACANVANEDEVAALATPDELFEAAIAVGRSDDADRADRTDARAQTSRVSGAACVGVQLARATVVAIGTVALVRAAVRFGRWDHVRTTALRLIGERLRIVAHLRRLKAFEEIAHLDRATREVIESKLTSIPHETMSVNTDRMFDEGLRHLSFRLENGQYFLGSVPIPNKLLDAHRAAWRLDVDASHIASEDFRGDLIGFVLAHLAVQLAVPSFDARCDF